MYRCLGTLRAVTGENLSALGDDEVEVVDENSLVVSERKSFNEILFGTKINYVNDFCGSKNIGKD